MIDTEIEQAAKKAYPNNDYMYDEFNPGLRDAFIAGAQYVLSQQEKDAEGLKEAWHKWYRELAPNTEFIVKGIWDFFKPHMNTQKEGWVSVDERLPEQGQVVLIWKKELVHPWTAKYQDGHFQSERDYCPGDRLLVFYYGVVTHWMPLPNPPSKP